MRDVTLVVLTAGMGSHYRGLKRIDPIGPDEEIIPKMLVSDAIRASFNKVIFIIKKMVEEDFKRAIRNKTADHIEVEYVLQEMDTCLPEGYEIPAGRVKPWGTAHAILCCKNVVYEPFAVIGVDDYYGTASFQKLHDYLVFNEDETVYSMVGFVLGNTLVDHGSVARGVCKVEDDKLTGVDERTGIEKHEGEVQYCENNTWYDVNVNSLVFMNMWGLTPKFMEEMEEHSPTFLQEAVKENPLKSEFYIPVTVDTLIHEGKAIVIILSSSNKRYSVTYQRDKPMVKERIHKLIETGKYPVPL